MESMGLMASGSFFYGKRVLITGHSGFKGAWLSLLLNELGAEVLGISLLPQTWQPLLDKFGLHSSINESWIDVRNVNKLRQAIQEYKPEIVFHLAAQPIVLESYKTPLETFDTNVMGTANLLESLRRIDVLRSVVIVTSDKCYHNPETLTRLRETDPLGGIDPYSASKAAAEIVVASYRKSFFGSRVGVATARAGNVIGGGDWSPDRLVPDCIRALMENKPVHLRHLMSVRPWQHVLDPLWGYLLLAERLYFEPDEYGRAWNFGPDECGVRTVEDLIRMIYAVWQREPDIVNQESKYHEAKLLMLDSSRSRFLLKWKPRFSVEQAAQQTAAWYLRDNQGNDMAAFSRYQIREYLGNTNINEMV